MIRDANKTPANTTRASGTSQQGCGQRNLAPQQTSLLLLSQVREFLYALPLPLPLPFAEPAICFCCMLLGTHIGWFSKNSLCRALTACEACWLWIMSEMLTYGCGSTRKGERRLVAASSPHLLLPAARHQAGVMACRCHVTA
jgi:hypothetical protein